jgi:hypothetical protein
MSRQKMTDVQKEMRKRYPGRVFYNVKDAENYHAMAREKGLDYHMTEHRGAYVVDKYKRDHPYWRPMKADPGPKYRYYDEEGREM